MRFWARSACGVAAGIGLLVAVGAAPTSAWAQQQPAQKDCKIVQEDGTVEVWPDCKPPADVKVPPPAAPNVAKKFPFPGEPVTTPAPTQPASPAVPAASGAAGDNNDVPAAKRFPFPGEQAAPATPAPGGGLQDAGSSGSSSSSDAPDSSSSSSNALPPESGSAGPLGDDDPAARAAAERKAARHKLPPVARQSPDEQEQEDLKVASFYMDDKNYRGAYLRATDAVSIAADDADAHFALAEAARRLGKLDEAMVHYKKCLTLDPEPKVKKSAEKALKEMAGG